MKTKETEVSVADLGIHIPKDLYFQVDTTSLGNSNYELAAPSVLVTQNQSWVGAQPSEVQGSRQSDLFLYFDAAWKIMMMTGTWSKIIIEYQPSLIASLGDFVYQLVSIC